MADIAEKKTKEGGDGSTLTAVLEKKGALIPYQIIEEEKLPGSRVRFKLKVEDSAFESRLDETFKDFGKQARLPGFRPGKAPKNLIRKSFENPAREETVKRMVPRLSELYAADKNLETLSQPYLLGYKSEKANGTTIEIAIEIHPEIVVNDELLKDLAVDVHKIRLDDDYVSTALENIRSQNATYEPTEEGYQPKDGLLFDCTVLDVEGHVIAERSVKEYYSTKIDEELPEQVAAEVVGKKKGDELHLDIEEFNEEIGRTEKVHYDLVVREVKRRVLPALDDDFAKDVSENFQSLEDLRNHVKDTSSNTEEARQREEALNEVYGVLRERIDFDLPRAMVENTAQKSFADMEKRLNDYGLSLRTMDQSIVRNYAASMHEQARINVKNYLLVRAISKAWGVKPEESQVNDAVENIARQMGRKPLAVRAQLEAKKQWDQFMEDLTLKVTNDKVLEKAKLNHKEVNSQEFEEIQRQRQQDQAARLQGLATAHDHDHDHEGHDHDHDHEHGHEGHTHH